MNAGGSISISSSSPFDSPVITPNMLSPEAPFDIRALSYAVQAARRFVSASSFDGYIISEYESSANATTEEEIEAWIRENAYTIDHVSCTVPMTTVTNVTSGGGVLNTDLTVKGTVGLRVVDASVLVSRVLYLIFLRHHRLARC